ncbi:MAG: ribonuclease activity regulator RraA [Chloroflexi bacterium]|nr:ribonuclease activity regulator RraA [Chloroflexota bacterium]
MAQAPNDAELRAKLATVTTATASALLYRRGFPYTYMHDAHPIQHGMRVSGRAVTVRLGPGRPDLATSDADRNTKDPLWVAIEALQDGDFLVMDCGGNQQAATTGDILAARIKRRGAVGILCDGAIRDAAQIQEFVGIPAWSRGVHGLGFMPTMVSLDWGKTVRCFGVTVIPGDYILADDDGAVMVPAALAAEIAEVGAEQELKETFIRGLVQQGVPVSECYPPNAETLRKFEEWKTQR